MRPGERSKADFAREYLALRDQGLTQREIAAVMGWREKSVGRKVSRCRAAGLLPPPAQATPSRKKKPSRECGRCHRTRPHGARGLCESCYVLESKAHRLDRWPRSRNTSRPLADMVEDFLFLDGTGIGLQELATRLGYPTPRRLGAALASACRKGLLDRSRIPVAIFARERGGEPS